MPTDKNISTPELLGKYFEQYKKLCKDNPKLENIYDSKNQRQVGIEREIPLTWNGFELYLRKRKIVKKLEDYKANPGGRYEAYTDIIREIDIEIYEDKFTGAVAGVYQHNIIARDLGLQDSNKMEHTGEVMVTKLSPEQRDARIAELKAKLNAD